MEGPSLLRQLQGMQQEMEHSRDGRRDQTIITIIYQEKDDEAKIPAPPEPKMCKGKNYCAYGFCG